MRFKEEAEGAGVCPEKTQTHTPALDIDQMVEDIKRRLKLKVKRRSSPYHVLAGKQSVFVNKCPKCYCRSCECKWSSDSSQDPCKSLKQLLREQSLIQEAVRRLLSKSGSGTETVLEKENRTRDSTCINNSDASDDDLDV